VDDEQQRTKQLEARSLGRLKRGGQARLKARGWGKAGLVA